jgi:limonene-1,2-epoxide hydrolase
MLQFRLARVLVAVLLTVPALSLAEAQSPVQFEAIERYAALVNDGAKAPLRVMFNRGVTHAEYALSWKEERGTAALPPLYALIDAGARLDVEFHAVASAGDVIITRERMWVDGADEALTPLRSTGVYVVDGDRILSITRVVDADQRDVLMREALVGRWQMHTVRLEYDADGGYRFWRESGERVTESLDSGGFVIEGGVHTFVRDDATQVCEPGDVGVWRVRFVTQDTIDVVGIDDMCRLAGLGAVSLRLHRVVD